jgi:hypothetical protein
LQMEKRKSSTKAREGLAAEREVRPCELISRSSVGKGC